MSTRNEYFAYPITYINYAIDVERCSIVLQVGADLRKFVIRIKNKDLTTVRLKANLLNEITAASVNSALDMQACCSFLGHRNAYTVYTREHECRILWKLLF